MSKRVLIVDDNPEIQIANRIRLSAAGFQVECAASGALGLELAARQQPDAIVLDIRMPELNGLEVLQVLKQRPETQGIPVVMLSASVGDERTALVAGARFFLPKPCAGETLVDALNVAMAT